MNGIKLLFVLTIGTLSTVYAQPARMLTSGTIEFEKSINTYALIKKSPGTTKEIRLNQEEYIKANPQFKVLQSTLNFRTDQTLYVPAPDVTHWDLFTGNPMVEQLNTVYTNVATHSLIAQKKVFEETFVVKDSTRRIRWKITGETREIAGYLCRRANAVIMDSIYVVAFYTGEIPVSGGPESFSGLPGMILGVALPYENITWFAKKVTALTAPSVALPLAGNLKTVNGKELQRLLEPALKSKGMNVPLYLKGLLL